MKVILIEHYPKYDDCVQTVGVAINMDIAEKHVNELQKKYPYAYIGRFDFTEFDLIDTIKE